MGRHSPSQTPNTPPPRPDNPMGSASAADDTHPTEIYFLLRILLLISSRGSVETSVLTQDHKILGNSRLGYYKPIFCLS